MSFFRYPGGKSKLKNEIVKKLNSISYGLELEYREPFFGGGSIGLKFLETTNAKRIWINDLDLGVYCLWFSVIHCPKLLKQKIMDFKPTTDAFYEYKNELQTTPYFEEIDELAEFGFKKLAIHQISYSGLGTKSGGPLGGVSQQSKYKIDCRWSPNSICRKIESIQKQFSKFNIEVSGLDFNTIIANDKYRALIYLDPPYYVKGNDLYQRGFKTEDHIRLADSLKNTNHKWVLSYDDCDEIRDLYDWAIIEEIKDINYSITALKNKETGERTSIKKSELLITSK